MGWGEDLPYRPERKGSPVVDIVAIGSELTEGSIRDVNAYRLARGISGSGGVVRRVQIVPDDRELMLSAIRLALDGSDWVVVTGGLGPTDDDFTKRVLLEIYGGDLVLHGPSYEAIEERLRARGLGVSERNRSQALIPDRAIGLFNRWGSATGMLFPGAEGSTLVSLPGVPSEMEGMLEAYVVPMIAYQSGKGRHEVARLSVFGISEAALAERLEPFETELPEALTLGYIAEGNLRVLLHLHSAVAVHELGYAVDPYVERLRALLGDAVVSAVGEGLAAVVHRQLGDLGLTISTAESCTAGSLAHALSRYPGSSVYLRGGLVTYSDAMKEALLGVDAGLIRAYGAVSEEVALAMAEGSRRCTGADIGVSSTGLLGPDGDGSRAQVGELHYAIAGPAGTVSGMELLRGDREYNARQAVLTVLNALRLFLDGMSKER